MMAFYSAIVETLILVAVTIETYITWQYLSYNHKQRIKRHVRKMLRTLGVYQW